jgi:5-methylcytosine-specific restriction endonuclease McrA
MPDVSVAVRRRIEKIDILLWLYGNACFWCDAEMILRHARDQQNRFPDRAATVDELRPRALGGRRVLSNQVLACHLCNNRRGSRMAPAEAIAGHLALLECHDLLRMETVEYQRRAYRNAALDEKAHSAH